MEYKTKDKGLTAFLLLCEDIHYLGYEFDGRFLNFKFTPAERAEKNKIKYETSNIPLVQPLRYYEKLRLVSRWLYEWRLENSSFSDNRGFYK